MYRFQVPLVSSIESLMLEFQWTKLDIIAGSLVLGSAAACAALHWSDHRNVEMRAPLTADLVQDGRSVCWLFETYDRFNWIFATPSRGWRLLTHKQHNQWSMGRRLQATSGNGQVVYVDLSFSHYFPRLLVLAFRVKFWLADLHCHDRYILIGIGIVLLILKQWLDLFTRMAKSWWTSIGNLSQTTFKLVSSLQTADTKKET